MPARVAEQSTTEVTHTPDGRGTCVEVVVVEFSWTLTAFLPTRMLIRCLTSPVSLRQGTGLSAGPPVIQKLKCLNIK